MWWAVAAYAAGTIMKAYGEQQAAESEAQANLENAKLYKEQAEFAREAGERQREIFDRESEILLGDQMSAFAKAGVDTSNSSMYLAKSMLFRSQESYAIKTETDMNVRLAMLRGDHAIAEANRLKDPNRLTMSLLGGGLQMAGQSGMSSGGGDPKTTDTTSLKIGPADKPQYSNTKINVGRTG